MTRIISVLLASALFFTTKSADAQVNVNVNIGTQPVWGPTGYDHVDYYYIPDVSAYYNVSRKQYVYREGNRWVFRKTLPAQYHDFDVYKNYKVVINEKQPWLHDEENRQKYESYKNRHDQPVIRDSHDSKYFVNKNHPQHKEWAQQQRKEKRH